MFFMVFYLDQVMLIFYGVSVSKLCLWLIPGCYFCFLCSQVWLLWSVYVSSAMDGVSSVSLGWVTSLVTVVY